ncbi:uncharacterized protein G2W53_000995 [Senna tora]|uniref:Uncharacterized protein n=1 Tax=Senna tora TaxID=362788 RepID=A0A834XER4_9FABA|nr:uncharacterized protein G2W53_000995 [Senna tora]
MKLRWKKDQVTFGEEEASRAENEAVNEDGEEEASRA